MRKHIYALEVGDRVLTREGLLGIVMRMAGQPPAPLCYFFANKHRRALTLSEDGMFVESWSL